MKTKLLSVLLCLLILLPSCAKEQLEEETEQGLPPLDKPDEIYTSDTENESEPPVFEVEEYPPEIEEEEENETQITEISYTEDGYINVCLTSSEIYYLTSVTDKAYGESDAHYTDSDRILGAIIFDKVFAEIEVVENRDRVENLNGERGSYGWLDNCIYDLSEECMRGETVTFVTKDEIFSLDGAEILSGVTSEGKSWTAYKTSQENSSLYFCFIDIGCEKMAAMLFSDDGEHENIWENCYRPMLEGCRTYCSDDGRQLVFSIDLYESENDRSYSISLTLPDSWSMNYTIASDIPRTLEGRYATKRLEIFRGLNVSTDGLSRINEGIGKTSQGYEYKWYSSKGISESERNLGVTQYYIDLAIPESIDENGDRVFISMAVFDDDEDSYYELFCLPLLDSIFIEKK